MVSMELNKSHVSSVLVAAGKEMGVSKEKVEVHLAWDNPVCMVLVE